MQTTIKCKNCGSSVIPSLLQTDDSWYEYSSTQHVCPLCGVVMFETGGEIRTEIKLVALAIITIFAFGALKSQAYYFFVGLVVGFCTVSVLAFPTASGKMVKRVKRLIFK